MKRSEMLSKIASVITNYNEVHCIINCDKAMEMAETILQIQEEVGMLPPFTDKRGYCALRRASLVIKTTWEPEDE